MPKSDLGRHVLGAAALAFGVIALVWHDYHHWDQLRSILNASDGPVFLYVAAAAQIVGGAAMLFRRTARTGALVLGATYLLFALVCVPRIVRTPLIYDAWGNFFEPFSLATGAAIVYGRSAATWRAETLGRSARVLVGICVASFTLEQAFYLNATAELVPKWLPPSQTFWAQATTVLFGLAAVALLTNLVAPLATRLLALMLVGFGLLVWVPLVVAHPQSYGTWSETIETFAIVGVVWILADLLRSSGGATAAVGINPAR